MAKIQQTGEGAPEAPAEIPTLDTLDDLYLAIERGRGVVELVAQCVSDGTIECTGYITRNGLAAVLSAALKDLEMAGATITGLPRRT